MTVRLIDAAHWQKLISETRQVRQSARYQNASNQELFDAVNDKLNDLQQNRDITMQQFLTIQKKLGRAVDELDGQETTKYMLHCELTRAVFAKQTARYVNASPNRQMDFDIAETEAKEIAKRDEFILQSQVDQATNRLRSANTSLDGLSSDFSQLAVAFKAAQKLLTTPEYLNAPQARRQQFDHFFEQARQILSQAVANEELSTNINALNVVAPNYQAQAQDHIDQVAGELLKSRKRLNGTTSDLSVLQTTLEQMKNVIHEPRYFEAGDARKHAFDQAITEAETALKSSTTTQKQADCLTSQLRVTYDTLDGNEVKAFNNVAFDQPDQSQHHSEPLKPADNKLAEQPTQPKPTAAAALSSMLGFKRSNKNNKEG